MIADHMIRIPKRKREMSKKRLTMLKELLDDFAEHNEFIIDRADLGKEQAHEARQCLEYVRSAVETDMDD